VSTLTAAVELLVGLACVAFGWISWQRGGTMFRIVGAALAVAGTVAIVNAVAELAGS
jgi:hypothetical protein